MCHAFACNGHDVTLFVPNRSEAGVDISGFRSIYDYYGIDRNFRTKKVAHPYFKGKDIVYSLLSASELVRLRPDIAYGRYLANCWIAAEIGYPVIYEAHTLITPANGMGHKVFQRLIDCSNLKKIVVISDALRKLYQNMYKLPSDMITVAHDAAGNTNKGVPWKKWPGRKNALQVGYAGSLYAGRGIELIGTLAEALGHCDFHLLGGQEDEIKAWRSVYQHSNLFLHGYVNPGMVPGWLQRCDVLLAPYQRKVSVAGDGKEDTVRFMSPLKIFEYMASGKAMVVSDLPVLREVLDNTIAEMVPPEDVNAWIEAILKLRGKEYRENMGRMAFERYQRNFTWRNRAKVVLQ